MKQDPILVKLSNIEEQLKTKPDTPLTFHEACEYLHFKPSYLYKLTSQRKIKSYKPNGKMLFFTKKDLNEWIFGKYVRSGKEKARCSQKQEVIDEK